MRIKIYSVGSCIHCNKLKNWLTNEGIPYENKDVKEDPFAFEEFKLLGGQGVPLTVIQQNNKQDIVVTGNDPQKIVEVVS